MGRAHHVGTALTWLGIAASMLSTVVLALPTWRQWWFGDALRTDVSTLESWANPAFFDTSNGFNFLPMQAFLASLVTVLIAALALRRRWLSLLGAATALFSLCTMLLGWAVRAGHAPAATPALVGLVIAACALFAALVLRAVSELRAPATAQPSAPSPTSAPEPRP